ncbi:hypothetical protein V3H18_16220, partial [Methylocystis sp. 9N]
MTDISDDKELMAEFAEFKELLRRDLGAAAPPPEAPVVSAIDPEPAATQKASPAPQPPRAEEA